MGNRRNNHSRQVALGGICTALALCAMLFGGMFPLTTFVVPIFASLFIIPVVFEMGAKTALVAYFAVAILSWILVPNKETSMSFLMLTGYYPALRLYVQKIGNIALRFVLKLALFNVSVLLSYSILLFVIMVPSLQQEFIENAPWVWVVSFLIGDIMFVLYDLMIDKVKIFYCYRIRKRFFP